MWRVTSVILLLFAAASLWAQTGGGRIPDSVTSGHDLHTPEVWRETIESLKPRTITGIRAVPKT